MDDLQSTFMQSFHPYKVVSVDEMMVPFKGRHFLRVRLRSKPKDTGFKVFALCDTVSGYIYSFVFNGDPAIIRALPNIGHSGTPVSHLVAKLPNSGHSVYVDNWFMSFNLAWDILNQGCWCLLLPDLNYSDITSDTISPVLSSPTRNGYLKN